MTSPNPTQGHWSLDVFENDTWTTLTHEPSGNACKTAARKHRETIRQGIQYRTVRYRIYDPRDLLWQESVPQSGDIIRWTWSDPRPRNHTPE